MDEAGAHTPDTAPDPDAPRSPEPPPRDDARDAAGGDDGPPGIRTGEQDAERVHEGAGAPESGSPVIETAPAALEHEAPSIPPETLVREMPLPALRTEPMPAAAGEPGAVPAGASAPVAEPAPGGGPEVTAEAAAEERRAAEERQAAERAAAAEQAAEHARQAGENARKLETAIDALRTGHVEDGRHQYQAFFEHERSVQAMFKSLRPLQPADRQRLWTAFKQIGTEVRRAQQEEWESRRYQSIEARENVEERIRKAEALASGAEGATGFRRADSILNEVRALLGSEAAGSAGQVLIGPDRRACWDRWRKARDVLRQSRGTQQEHDRAELEAQTAEVAELARTGDPFQAIQRIKQLQGRLGAAFLRRGQFEELRRKLSDSWLAAQARVTDLRQERSKHRAEWRERMEGHVTRWKETIEHKTSQREHLLRQLEKLEEMEKNARSEDFAVQVRGWRAETQEKLQRTEGLVAELEQRIRDAVKRIGGGRGSRGGQDRRERREGRGPRPGAPAAPDATPAQPPAPESPPSTGGAERGPEYGEHGEVLPPPDESGPPPEGVGGP